MMQIRFKKGVKKHLKGEPKVLQNEIKIGIENGVGKVLRREGFWAKMIPKMDPKLSQKGVQTPVNNQFKIETKTRPVLDTKQEVFGEAKPAPYVELSSF